MTTPVEPLTDREHQLLRLLADGHTLVDVARVLHVSESTVKTHCAGLYRKLGAGTAAHAVARGFALAYLATGLEADAQTARYARELGYRLALVPLEAT